MSTNGEMGVHRRKSLPLSDYTYCTDRYYLRRIRELLQDAVKPRPQPPADPVQLTQHVYLGNQRNADDCELLRTIGITHVLSCANTRRTATEDIPYSLADTGIRGFLLIPAEDREDYNIERFFDTTTRFVRNVRLEGGRVLVHCTMGVNRSAAIVAAYLMVDLGWNLLTVISYLKTKRLHVLSNKGFRRQLVSFARQQGCLDPVLRSTRDGRSRDASIGLHDDGRDSLGDIITITDVRRRSVSAGRRQRIAAYNIGSNIMSTSMIESSTGNISNGLSTKGIYSRVPSAAICDTRAHYTSTSSCSNKLKLDSTQEDVSINGHVRCTQNHNEPTLNPETTPKSSNGPNHNDTRPSNSVVLRHCSSYTHYININYQLPNDVTVTSPSSGISINGHSGPQTKDTTVSNGVATINGPTRPKSTRHIGTSECAQPYTNDTIGRWRPTAGTAMQYTPQVMNSSVTGKLPVSENTNCGGYLVLVERKKRPV